jgi:integrase
MRAKKWARGQVWYYLDKGVQPDGSRPWVPLGSSFPDALRAYAEQVETMKAPPLTVPELLSRWSTETAPDCKAGTLDDIRFSLPNLMRFFGDPPAPLEQVDPIHIRQYLDWRLKAAKETKKAANAKRVKDGKKPIAIRGDEGKVRANREIAWFSAAWNWARDRGLTKALNPTVGVRRHREAGRSMYVENEELAAILLHADEPLREAIELAYLIGQRPGDLRQIRETDIRDGCIVLEQGKTDAKLRIEVTGALAVLIERIKARKAAIAGGRSLSLICDERGQPMLKSGLRHRFDRAREAAAQAAPNQATAERLRAIQFRDLRAKAASDMEALDKAQALLGHTTRGMTEAYVRSRRGDRVKPVK